MPDGPGERRGGGGSIVAGGAARRAALAGDRRDLARVHAAHAVRVLVGQVDVSVRGERARRARFEARGGRRPGGVVVRRRRADEAGERVDGACGIDHPHALRIGVDDVEIAGGVEREGHRLAEVRGRRRAAVAVVAARAAGERVDEAGRGIDALDPRVREAAEVDPALRVEGEPARDLERRGERGPAVFEQRRRGGLQERLDGAGRGRDVADRFAAGDRGRRARRSRGR